MTAVFAEEGKVRSDQSLLDRGMLLHSRYQNRTPPVDFSLRAATLTKSYTAKQNRHYRHLSRTHFLLSFATFLAEKRHLVQVPWLQLANSCFLRIRRQDLLRVCPSQSELSAS